MITVDDNLIAKLEKLSSLKIEDDKKEKIKSDISQMLEFVNNLNEVDVSNVEAIASTVEGGTPFREDIAVSSKEISDAILKNAPKSEDNYFVVPKIIELKYDKSLRNKNLWKCTKCFEVFQRPQYRS